MCDVYRANAGDHLVVLKIIGRKIKVMQIAWQSCNGTIHKIYKHFIEQRDLLAILPSVRSTVIQSSRAQKYRHHNRNTKKPFLKLDDRAVGKVLTLHMTDIGLEPGNSYSPTRLPGVILEHCHK